MDSFWRDVALVGVTAMVTGGLPYLVNQFPAAQRMRQLERLAAVSEKLKVAHPASNHHLRVPMLYLTRKVTQDILYSDRRRFGILQVIIAIIGLAGMAYAVIAFASDGDWVKPWNMVIFASVAVLQWVLIAYSSWKRRSGWDFHNDAEKAKAEMDRQDAAAEEVSSQKD